MDKPYKIGLSLSGGGARGIAHIGALAAFEEHGIRPAIISGTSMGALVGVFYAAGYPPAQILQLVKETSMLKVFKWQIPSSGLFHLDIIRKILAEKIKVDDFSSLKIPFCCAVSNLNSGQVEIKSEGPLFDWVVASASIPVIFEPQQIGGQTYVDGGLFDNLPAAAIRDKAKMLIGIHVNHNGYQEQVKGFKEVAERTLQLSVAQNVKESISLCDMVITPPTIGQFHTFDFRSADQIFQVGYDETERKLIKLFDLLGDKFK